MPLASNVWKLTEVLWVFVYSSAQWITLNPRDMTLLTKWSCSINIYKTFLQKEPSEFLFFLTEHFSLFCLICLIHWPLFTLSYISTGTVWKQASQCVLFHIFSFYKYTPNSFYTILPWDCIQLFQNRTLWVQTIQVCCFVHRHP